MMDSSVYMKITLAFLAAGVVAAAATPFVKRFAFKVGAIDVPGGRHKHKKTTALMGGLAIFLGFTVSLLIFGSMDRVMTGIMLGALVIITISALDDIYDLKAWIRLLVHIGAALIPILYGGLRIEMFQNFFAGGERYFYLGVFSIPITVIWVVGMTNAVNWIDGLDGLAAGVSGISSVSLLVIACVLGDPYVAVIIAALAGAIIGFIPYNLNPAKIFIGDTGAMFLGYILATMSIMGLFKFYVVISFAVPFLILGLPIFNMLVAVVRRVSRGQSLVKADDRAHMHEKLVDMGFSSKQTVAILYCVSIVLGIAAVVLATSGQIKVILLILAVLLAAVLGLRILSKRERKPEEEEGDEVAGEDKNQE